MREIREKEEKKRRRVTKRGRVTWQKSFWRSPKILEVSRTDDRWISAAMLWISLDRLRGLHGILDYLSPFSKVKKDGWALYGLLFFASWTSLVPTLFHHFSLFKTPIDLTPDHICVNIIFAIVGRLVIKDVVLVSGVVRRDANLRIRLIFRVERGSAASQSGDPNIIPRFKYSVIPIVIMLYLASARMVFVLGVRKMAAYAMFFNACLGGQRCEKSRKNL